jgi:hypothetical protein
MGIYPGVERAESACWFDGKQEGALDSFVQMSMVIIPLHRSHVSCGRGNDVLHRGLSACDVKRSLFGGAGFFCTYPFLSVYLFIVGLGEHCGTYKSSYSISNS